jgi:hypothetical protein
MEFDEIFKTEILKLHVFGPLQPTKLMRQKDVLQIVGMTSTEGSYSLPTAVFPSSPSPSPKSLLLVAVTTNILVLKCDSYGG